MRQDNNRGSGTCPRRIVFAKFLTDELLAEQGRLLFAVLNSFACAGYDVRFDDNLPPDAGQYGRAARSIPGVTLSTSVPEDTAEALYVFDKQERGIGKLPWRKKVEVRFDIFSRYRFSAPILMPYPVHPLQAGAHQGSSLAPLRRAERSVRILFAGDTKGYDRVRITYPSPKMPRSEVIATVLSGMANEAIHVRDQYTLDSLLAAGYTNKVAIVESSNLRIDNRAWLDTLAKADFFLCPPGIVMPMCHNSVEAMAVGTIPILNYPEWFAPPLVNLRTCMTFDRQQDLIKTLRSVLQLSQKEIHSLRDSVQAHYDEHLAAYRFAQLVESHPDKHVVGLVISERYVARNAARLSHNSVLLRGGKVDWRPHWTRLFRAFVPL